MSKAIFPGSFDPFTKGHEEIVTEALKIFDTIVVGIGENSKKKNVFDIEKRINHINSIYQSTNRVVVKKYIGLTTNFCLENNATHIVRGLRNTMDFEYEKMICQMNNELSDISTIFFISRPESCSMTSSIIREIHLNQGDISSFVTNSSILV